jgi:hypothetical protein
MDNQETQAILGTRHRTKTSKPVVNPRVREGQAVPVCYMTPKCVTEVLAIMNKGYVEVLAIMNKFHYKWARMYYIIPIKLENKLN